MLRRIGPILTAPIASLLMLASVLAFALGDRAGDGTASIVPQVAAVGTFVVTKTTHVYAQALTHTNWGDPKGTATDLVLDLYVPQGAPGLRPAAIFIHGGGFIGGSRAFGALSRMAETLAARGWVCISVDYRLTGDRGTLPQRWMQFVEEQPLNAKARDQGRAIYAASRDVKAALRWLTAHADELSIDTTKLTALGGSAGAVLAIMLGVVEPEDFRDELTVLEDPTLATANLDAPSEVHSIVDFWGSAVAVELLEEVYGVTRFDSRDAPLLIVHGTEDPTVRYSEALELARIWTSSGVPFEFHTLVGAGHGAWSATIEGQPLIEIAFDFIVLQQGLIVTD